MVRIIKATAPIRICDIGGWTDTWFARHGKVFNIGVQPFVEATITVDAAGPRDGRVVLDAKNFGDRYPLDPADPPGRHPLLEAVVAEVGVPDELSLDISMFSDAPAGSSTGTSAAAAVALIGALDALTPGTMPLDEVARTAHRIETERMGIQSGVQDQLCAAYGGLNFIEVSCYPDVSVTPLALTEELEGELDRRLALFYLGRSHISSDVHDRVSAQVAAEGEGSPRLQTLRDSAQDARDAVLAGDLGGLGEAMVRNTDGQRALHPDLVSEDAQALIDLASKFAAVGWKVNGAGGDGGSVTILCGSAPDAKDRLVGAITDSLGRLEFIPTRISGQGLVVRQGDG